MWNASKALLLPNKSGKTFDLVIRVLEFFTNEKYP